MPLRLPAGVSPAAHFLNCPPDLLSSQTHPSTLPPVNIPHVLFLPKPEALSCIRKCFIDCPPVHRMVILYMTQPSGHQGRQWGQGCNPAGVVRTKQDSQSALTSHLPQDHRLHRKRDSLSATESTCPLSTPRSQGWLGPGEPQELCRCSYLTSSPFWPNS